jgi:hypothetical protein
MGADRLLAKPGADIRHVTTDAGKGGIDAAVIREEDVAPIVPSLQAEKDDRSQPGQEGQEDGEIDGLQHEGRRG